MTRFQNIQITGSIKVAGSSALQSSVASVLLAVASQDVVVQNVSISASMSSSQFVDTAAFVAVAQTTAVIINNATFTGAVDSTGVAGAFVSTISFGQVNIASALSYGFVRSNTTCGGLVGLIKAGSTMSTTGVQSNSSVSGSQYDGSFTPVPTSGTMVGSNLGTYTTDGTTSVSSGIRNGCHCGAGSCPTQCATFSKTISVSDLQNKSQVLVNGQTLTFFYGLGGAWDWNNSNIVFQNGFKNDVSFGAFDNYPLFRNIYITSTGSFSQSSSSIAYFGGLVAITNMSVRIEKVTVNISVQCSGSYNAAGFIGIATQDVSLINSFLYSQITANEVGGLIYQSWAALNLNNIQIDSLLQATSTSSLLAQIYNGYVVIQQVIANGHIIGQNLVAFIGFAQNSGLQIQDLYVSAEIIGTNQVASFVAHSVNTNMQITSSFSNARINAQGSTVAGSLISTVESGSVNFDNVTSSATGQFATCPMNWNSPVYVQNGVNCVKRSFNFNDKNFQSETTPNIPGLSMDYKITFFRINIGLNGENDYNNSNINVGVDTRDEDLKPYSTQHRYYSEFKNTITWFEGITLTGIRCLGGYETRGGSFVAYTTGVTIISCTSSIRYEGYMVTIETYGGRYEYGGFIGHNLGPSKIFNSTFGGYYYAQQCKTTMAGFVQYNKNDLKLYNCIYSGYTRSGYGGCWINDYWVYDYSQIQENEAQCGQRNFQEVRNVNCGADCGANGKIKSGNQCNQD
ncbi:Hypothetical_protein [Hexamita inflata]|uniref:Hypothetical_protein n=1 Tax=Hexamita inflata TaxID=28002 RepID=A0AA86Q112_9EUKA|nr:Hypothetical protein HINF_LOCUS36281 [Hexamita inflata]